jgi:hypothetical protein
MNGLIAKAIATTMHQNTSSVKRGLSTASESIAHLSGYLDALQDTGNITAEESSMMLSLFSGTVLEVH